MFLWRDTSVFYGIYAARPNGSLGSLGLGMRFFISQGKSVSISSLFGPVRARNAGSLNGWKSSPRENLQISIFAREVLSIFFLKIQCGEINFNNSKGKENKKKRFLPCCYTVSDWIFNACCRSLFLLKTYFFYGSPVPTTRLSRNSCIRNS